MTRHPDGKFRPTPKKKRYPCDCFDPHEFNNWLVGNIPKAEYKYSIRR